MAAQFGQLRERGFGGGAVELADRETYVQEDEVAGYDVVDERERDLARDAIDARSRALFRQEFDDLDGHRKTHDADSLGCRPRDGGGRCELLDDGPRLAVADRIVAAGQRACGEQSEVRGAQRVGERAHQQPVGAAAAAERDHVQVVRARGLGDPRTKRMAERGVPDARDGRGVGLRGEPAGERQEIEVAAVETPAVNERRARARERFEAQRGFAAIALLRADARESGDGVEPAAEARGRRAVEAAGELRAQTCGRGGVDAWRDAVLGAGLHIGTIKPIESIEQRERHARGRARRQIAAGQRQRREMTETRRTAGIDAQQLAAPRRAVVAVTEAVERDAERRIRVTVLGQHGGDVRVVMLHRHDRHVPARGQRMSEARRVKIGLEVAGERGGRRAAGIDEPVRGGVERGARRRAREVAEVRRDERARALRERDGAFQMRTEREHGWPRVRQRERLRRVTARAPQLQRRLRGGGVSVVSVVGVGGEQHAVVATRDDRAVVKQHGIGDTGERVARVRRIDFERLARDVRTRGDQQRGLVRVPPGVARRTAERFVEQQILKRRARQHHAELRETGRDAAERVVVASRGDDDGSRGRVEQRARGGVADDPAGRRSGVEREQRERFRGPPLAGAQTRDGVGLRRVADQLEAAEPFDRDDLAARNRSPRVSDGIGVIGVIAARAAQRCFEMHTRSADGARDQFGVKAPVRGIGVVGGAIGARRERRHARVGAVERQRARDGVARAAIAATVQRVAMAAVARVEDLREAGVADCIVGCHFAVARVRLAAFDDTKTRARRRIERLRAFGIDRIDARERRRFLCERCAKRAQRRARALHVDPHGARVVAHLARQAEALREPPDERSEPDALHDPAHAQLLSPHRRDVLDGCTPSARRDAAPAPHRSLRESSRAIARNPRPNARTRTAPEYAD
ncbi:hypothetical protein PT2222_300012 [Paraburkholderia tropica]